MATAPVGQHVTGPSSHSSTDTTDPITKFKILVPHLKESLQVRCAKRLLCSLGERGQALVGNA